MYSADAVLQHQPGSLDVWDEISRSEQKIRTNRDLMSVSTYIKAGFRLSFYAHLSEMA